MNSGDRFLAGLSVASDNMIMDQVMLRFRPIAPKPAADGSANGFMDPRKKKEIPTMKRAKRKYVRVNKSVKHSGTKNNKSSKQRRDNWLDQTVVTLELLPEIGKSSSDSDTNTISKDLQLSAIKSVQQLPSWLNFSLSKDLTAVMPPMSDVVESWVTVECVTGESGEEARLGCTDKEMLKNLEVDTCPGFVSEGVDVVKWVNLSYMRMVKPLEDGGGAPPEVVVWLEVKEKIPAEWGTFSCRVRVVYGRGKEKQSQILPCDVWKMEFGGFAWRLDVEAALSLGR